MSLKQFITTLCVLLITISVSAEVPNVINYQGRLTDAGGSPVADGGYLVKFTIYDDVGTDLWNSGFQSITTVDGLFNYEIGSNVALPLGIFDDTLRFLGITIGADPELTPRTRLNTVPYAKAIGTDYVNVTGDTMTGSLDLQSGGNSRALLTNIPSTGSLQLYGATNLQHAWLIASSWGELALYDSDEDLTVDIGASTSAGGYLSLYDPEGSEDIFLHAGGEGNTTVSFPENAIDNTEILDEPGIASGVGTYLYLSTIMQDLATITIDIPAPGYIYLTGRCWSTHTGSTASTEGVFQIDETAGGSYTVPYYTAGGASIASDASMVLASSIFVDRIYYKSSAGSYTFRFEGLKWNASATLYTGDSRITAIYYPSSYGSVATIAPIPPSDTEAEQVSMTNIDGSSSTGYKYDLRDLELKAKEAQLKAKEAELELLKARQQQNIKTEQ